MATVLHGDGRLPTIELEYHPDERGARMELIQHAAPVFGSDDGPIEKVYNGSTLKLHLGTQAFDSVVQQLADEIARREGRGDKPKQAHEVGDPFVLSEKYEDG